MAVSDRRRRGPSNVAELAAAEGLLALPELPFPAEYREERVVSRDALVSFESNQYSVAAGHASQTVEVRARLGELHLEIYTPAGRRIARHRRALAGAGQTIGTQEHARALEQAVLEQFTTRRPCARKPNRPPGEQALAKGGPAARRARRRRGHRPRAVRPDREGRRPAMNDDRFEARTTIRPGKHERRIDGSPLQLARVVLSDGGSVVTTDGTEHQRPDVICPLRPAEARALAQRLLALATQAQERTQR